MADRTVSVQLELDAQGAITGITLLDSRMLKAGKSVTDLQRRTNRARTVMVRAFRQMGRAASVFTKTIGGIRRALFTIRFLVLGFFIQQFVNRIVRPLIDASVDLDRAMFRLGSAVNAAQKRFGEAAGKIQDFFDLVVQLRSETNQFSIRELTEVVAGVAELGRNFGITGEQVKLLSRRILDLAAATGRTLTDVITRIRSGFLGSTEAIEDLGINFKVTRLQQEAFLAKMRGQFQLLRDTEQAQIRFTKAMKDTTEIQGALAKVTDTISGRMRALGAAWDDLILLMSQALVNTRGFRTVFEGVASLIQRATGNLKELSEAGKNLKLVINTLLGIFGSIFNFLKEGPKLFAAFLGSIKSTTDAISAMVGAVLAAQGLKLATLGGPLGLGEFLLAAIAGLFSRASQQSGVSIQSFFGQLLTIFKAGFKDFQLETEEFAKNAGGIFGDTFDIRDVDPFPIAETLKNAQSAMKALLSQFGGVRGEGILTRFAPPKDLLQFQRDTDRVAFVLRDLRSKVEKDLVDIRTSILSFGTDVRNVDIDEINNQFSKMAQALGETLTQKNDIIAFQQTMSDFGVVMGLINETIQISSLTFTELGAILSRLGISFEDFAAKMKGVRLTFKNEIGKTFDAAALKVRLLVDLFSSLGTLIGQSLSGATDPLKQFGATLLNILGTLAIQIGTLFIMWGIAIERWRDSFANPAAAIAAGIALVVIGAAIKGFASSFAGTAAAGTGATTAAPVGPTEFTVPLSSISSRQGIPEDRLTSTLNKLDEHFSRIEAQDGVLIVKDGVRRGGGINALLTSDDRRQLTQTVLRQPTLNTF